MRLIEIQAHGTIYRSLTNALDPLDLPTAHAAALSAQRWRVEEAFAFAFANRLLGLASFYGGAHHAVEMQLWATWILSAVLVDNFIMRLRRHIEPNPSTPRYLVTVHGRGYKLMEQ